MGIILRLVCWRSTPGGSCVTHSLSLMLSALKPRVCTTVLKLSSLVSSSGRSVDVSHSPGPIKVVVYGSLIDACESGRHWVLALQLLQEMPMQQVAPSPALRSTTICHHATQKSALGSKPRKGTSWWWLLRSVHVKSAVSGRQHGISSASCQFQFSEAYNFVKASI